MGAAFDEGEVGGGAGQRRLPHHPVAGAAHVEEVDGEVHGDRRAAAAAAAALASTPSRNAESMPPCIRPMALQWRFRAKKACTRPRR